MSTIEIAVTDLRELVAAAEEVRDEARFVYDGWGNSKNVLEEASERRLELALDQAKLKLSEVRHEGADQMSARLHGAGQALTTSTTSKGQPHE